MWCLLWNYELLPATIEEQCNFKGIGLGGYYETLTVSVRMD